MTVTNPRLPNRVTSRVNGNHQGASMLPDNFDPYFIVTGVKRRDWLAPVQPKQPQG